MTAAMPKIYVATLLIAFGCLAGCTVTPPVEGPPPRPDDPRAGDYDYTKEYVSWLVRRNIDAGKLTGVSIALVDENGIVWSGGFGHADREHNIPATADTVYRAGSLAKLVTAAAVLQLEDRRLLDIDAPVQTNLNQFSVRSRFPEADPITPRHLLTHHSGLPSDLTKGMWSADDFNQLVVELRGEYAAYPPDFVFSYSNLGYDLLGSLVQIASEEPFHDYVHEAIFRPLGMTHSSFSPTPVHAPLLAKGYQDGRAQELLPMRDVPAAGLYSTATDLARFVQMLLNGGRLDGTTVLERPTVEELFSAQNQHVALDFDFRIGLPWFLDAGGIRNAWPVARHGGTTMFFNSQVIVLPAHKLGVVVLSNTHGSRRLTAEIAERTLKLGLEAKAGITQPLLAGTRASRPAADEWAETKRRPDGRYTTRLGVLDISLAQGKMCACNAGKTLNLVPQPDGSLRIRVPAGSASPAAKEKLEKMRILTRRFGDREVLAVRTGDEVRLFGEKLPRASLPAAWEKRLGDYAVTNADPGFPVDRVGLRRRGDQLYFNYRLPALSPMDISVPVSPISDTEAITLGLGRNRGETIRIIAGPKGGESLVYSGYEARKR